MSTSRPDAEDADEMLVSIRVASEVPVPPGGTLDGLLVCDETVLVGELPDQAALHGVLGRLRQLGLLIVHIDTAP